MTREIAAINWSGQGGDGTTAGHTRDLGAFLE